MRKTAVAMGALVTSTAIILTGCSKGSESEAQGSGGMTINEFLTGINYDNYDWQDEERRIEEAVALCMRERGWEYIPVDYGYSDGGEWTPEDEEKYVKEQGFGLVYWYLYPDGDGSGDGIIIDDGWEDPNWDYVNSLSETEMTAYYEDLWGTEEENAQWMETEVDPETGEEYSYQWRSGGCRGEAEVEIRGEDYFQQMGNDYWERVTVFYDELQIRVEADPRIVELNKKWQQCMADRNYTFQSENDLYDWVYSDLQGRVEEVVPNMWNDPFAGWSDDEINAFYENATQEELDALWATPELTDEQRSQLEALYEEEIDLALANWECGKDSREKYNDIYAQIETEYVRENEAALAALKEELKTK